LTTAPLASRSPTTYARFPLGIIASLSPSLIVPLSTLPWTIRSLSFILSKIGILSGPSGSLPSSTGISSRIVRSGFPLYHDAPGPSNGSLIFYPVRPAIGTQIRSLSAYPVAFKNGFNLVLISSNLS